MSSFMILVFYSCQSPPSQLTNILVAEVGEGGLGIRGKEKVSFVSQLNPEKSGTRTHGIKMNKPLEDNLSREIAQQIKSKAKSSFDNTYKAALLHDRAMYVQGFLVGAGKPGQPMEHSWLEFEEYLVDPTLPHLNKNAQELYYFPAQRLSVKQVKAAVEEAIEDYPDDPPLPVYGAAPYEYYGDLMLGGRDYQAAYEEALAKCRELKQSSIKKEE